MNDIFKKKIMLFLTSLFFVVLLFGVPQITFAQSSLGGFFGSLIGMSLFAIVSWILYIPIHFFGFLLSSVLIPLVIWVASYNNFVAEEGVMVGWMAVRDIANMFIILGVLVIAFGTLFNLEAYSYKKLLPKIVLAAVLINFSKSIMGVIIDISQVIMLTFVHAFDDIAGGSLINAIGLQNLLSFAFNIEGAKTIFDSSKGLEIFGALILAVIVLVVSSVVLLVIVSYLVARIIFLWIAIVLSPLLFALPLIPSGQKFASQIWNSVSKYLIAGPILAFFLWLSFTILSTLNGNTDVLLKSPKIITDAQRFNAAISQFGNINNILNFIVVIGLLMGSLMVASQMGVAGSKMAGNFMGKMQQFGAAAAKWTAMRPVKGYVRLAEEAKAGHFGKGLKGLEFNPVNWYKNFKESGERKRKERIIEGDQAAGERMMQMGTVGLFAAMGSKSGWDKIRQGFMYKKGIGSFYETSPEDIKKTEEELKKAEKEEERKKREAEGPNAGEAMIENLKSEQVGIEALLKQIDNDIKILDKPKEEMDAAKLDLQILQDKISDLRSNNKKNEADKLEREQLPILQEAFNEKEMEYKNGLNSRANQKQLLKIKESQKKNELNGIKTNVQMVESYQKIDPQKMASVADSYWSQKANDADAEMRNLRKGGLTDEQKKNRQEEIKELRKQENRILGDISSRGKPATQQEQDLLHNIRNTIHDRSHNVATVEEFKANEKIIDELQKDKKNFDAQATRNYTETEREQIRQEYQDAKKETKDKKSKLQDKVASLPQDYYGRVDAQSKIYEELRKINTTNADELTTIYKSAEKAGDKFLAAAAVIKTTMAGHLNELLDDNEYEQNNDGLNKFINERLIDKLGMNKQWAYSIQNDASSEAEHIGHWNFAQSIGYKNGQMAQRDFKEQQLNVRIEQMKYKGKEALYRDLNRLGWMTEYRDEKTGSRMSILNPAAIAAIRHDYKNIQRSIERQALNPNYAANLVTPKNWAILEGILREIPDAEKSDFRGMMKDLEKYAFRSEVREGEGVGDKIKKEIDTALKWRQAGGTF